MPRDNDSAHISRALGRCALLLTPEQAAGLYERLDDLLRGWAADQGPNN